MLRHNFLKSNIPHLIMVIVTVTLCIIQQVHDITSEPVKIWDEGSSAQLAVEMLANKSYFIVNNDGVPEHLDVKPPLQLWLKVISYKIFGINEFAVRFPSIMANFLIMLVFIIFSFNFLKLPMLAWFIPLLMASTPGYMDYHVARTGDPDTLLILFITCYLLSYIIFLEKYPVTKYKYLLFFGISVVLAIYTKSIAGLAPLFGVAIFTFIHPNGRKSLLKPELYLTSVAIILLVLSYYFIREIYDPGYLEAVMKWELNLFGSYPGTPKHPETVFYTKYLQETAFRPYFNFIPLVLIPLILSKNNRQRRIILYALLGAGVLLLGQSLSLTKNEWYIAPIYPFLWLLVALGIYELVMTVPSLIKNHKISIAVQFLLAFSILYFTIDRYTRILGRNQKSPIGYVYEPERAGMYLRDLKSKKPELKKITAFIDHHPRQLKFYAKKFQYEDSTQLEILYKLDEVNLTGKKVYVCDSILLKQLLANYNLEQLDSAKYCKFFLVRSLRDSSDVN